MDLNKFCECVREKYPAISKKADIEYDKYWNSIVKMEFSSYSWFESLANALNLEMKKKASVESHIELLEFISSQFSVGIEEVRNAIDVAFVENLFWQVSATEAKPYWQVLPNNLRNLYVGFHSHTPL